jgi:hypothetical protein
MQPDYTFIYIVTSIFAKMATIQLPLTTDAATTISAFSIAARHTFNEWLSSHTNRFRITGAKRAEIISWIIDDLRAPQNQSESSKQFHIRRTYRYDAERDILIALPSDGHSQERKVVVQDEIFSVIEQEHLLSKHAGQETTWASISKTYYGISRQDVKYLLKQCEICHKKAVNRSRGALTPIISTELFE